MKKTAIIRVSIACAGLGIAVFVFILFLTQFPLDYAGRTEALSVCKNCVLNFYIAANTKGDAFNIQSLSPEDKANIVKCYQDGWSSGYWIPNANIFVRTNIILESGPTKILLVCDKSGPTGFLASLRTTQRYAVGYSDGSSGLITEAEFRALNLFEFIDLSKLSANSDSATGKNSRL